MDNNEILEKIFTEAEKFLNVVDSKPENVQSFLKMSPPYHVAVGMTNYVQEHLETSALIPKELENLQKVPEEELVNEIVYRYVENGKEMNLYPKDLQNSSTIETLLLQTAQKYRDGKELTL